MTKAPKPVATLATSLRGIVLRVAIAPQRMAIQQKKEEPSPLLRSHFPLTPTLSPDYRGEGARSSLNAAACRRGTPPAAATAPDVAASSPPSPRSGERAHGSP